ncbi:MAG TPA: DUF4186 domain-containing protein [Candidatus Anaerotignum merdipullorum]|nr:DUF4186 domain-containing protein [Candidatus Anaerotignum merdipullorum]
MQTITQALEKLRQSKFRSRFVLHSADLEYIQRVGMDTIQIHAVRFVKERLAPANPKNDGKQTPMKGHPVFIAQHATACCCRGCLHRWYGVAEGKELSDKQQQKIVNLIMSWIAEQICIQEKETRTKERTSDRSSTDTF